MMVVSAVVLSYNRCAEVLKTIGLLKEYKAGLPFTLEIIVVDNASEDDTNQQLTQHLLDIKLVTVKRNNGIAGWNEGFKVATGKYMLVLDDDSCIYSGLANAVDYLEINEKVGILALNVVGEELRGDPNLSADDAWKDGEHVAGFIGCGAIIRKALYDKIGGFAEWIYLYTHEFDYSIRCWDAGYQVHFFEKGIVVHRSSVINRSNKRMRILAARNEMAIVYKYFNNSRGKYIARTLLNNLKFIKREGVRSAYYVLLGAIDFLKLKKKIGQTPVSPATQEFYANRFWSTKPVLANLRKKLR